jgi:hypothetical protein
MCQETGLIRSSSRLETQVVEYLGIGSKCGFGLLTTFSEAYKDTWSRSRARCWRQRPERTALLGGADVHVCARSSQAGRGRPSQVWRPAPPGT